MKKLSEESERDDLDKNKPKIWTRIVFAALSIVFTCYLLHNTLNHMRAALRLNPSEFMNSVVESAISSIWLIFLSMVLIASVGWGLYLHKYLTEKST